jgi:hypothetical protein
LDSLVNTFESCTKLACFLGHAWTSDYGCSDKEEEFHWMIK